MGVMPYQFEKGLFPLALEAWFNEGLDAAPPAATAPEIMAPAATPVCVGRRLRAIWRYGQVARLLRGPFNPGVTEENSFVLSGFFNDPKLVQAGIQRTIAQDWFGMTPPTASEPSWRRPDPQTWTSATPLGMWNGYYGHVELIVAETLQRMLEVSLGLDHRAVFPAAIYKSDAAQKQVENELRQEVKRVWPIYLFLTCPKPWFEGWVTWQCHAPDVALRGQVTVILATPGHSRPVTPSPIDLEHDQEMIDIEDPWGQPVFDTVTKQRARRPNPYFLRGVADSGYDGIVLNAVQGGAQKFQAAGTDPVGCAGEQGMWVVSHENHDSAIVINSFAEPNRPNWNPSAVDPAEAWDLPPIATYRPATWEERADVGGTPDPTVLSGYDRIAVVQPAGRDGGIP